MIKKLLPTMAWALIALTGCTDSNTWTVDGTIEGASDADLILEASTNGRWYPLDTVTLTGSGRFSFTQPAAGYPDIYRLRLRDRMLYFPIDSVETVTVTATAESFDTDYNLSGSQSAERLMAVDRKLGTVASPANDSILKRELSADLLEDPAGIVAYYIINKRVGGQALFDPANKRDLRVIGAVANAFSEKRPADPRTTYLTRLYTTNLSLLTPRTATATDTIVAPELGVLDIELYDEKGTLHSLSELAEKGRPVVLNFTSYTSDFSPALNVALNRVYEQYAPQGLEIFQVGVDDDEYQWRQSARNLPWTTVYNSPAHDGGRFLLRYNVTSLPATFIIGRDGEIKKRVDDLSTLQADVARNI